MRIHFYERENESDKSYQDVGGASWALCGKRISNKAVTVSDMQVTCATCLKIFERNKVSEQAA